MYWNTNDFAVTGYKMECLTTSLILSGVLSIASAGLDLIWPLNDYTYTAEILQQPVDQNISGCSMSFGPDKFVGMRSASFDGNSSLDLLVESNVDGIGKKYAFSGWFYLTDTTGSLFHYKANNLIAVVQEMKLVVISQYIQAIKVVSGVTEAEMSATPVVLTNTWYFISFGIDPSSGKIRVQIDSSDIIEKENGPGNIGIELPGILRIGKTFDNSIPPLTGYVTCVGFHTDEITPTSTDSFNLCSTSQMSVSNCFKPLELTVHRDTPIFNGQKIGRFVKYTASTNNLEELDSTTQCSVTQCALYCLPMEDCRYIQYDGTSTGCTTCYLLKFGDGSINTSNGIVYKYEVDY